MILSNPAARCKSPLDFIGFCLKSPIENEKMVFYGTELPDFTRVSYTNKKSTSKGAFY